MDGFQIAMIVLAVATSILGFRLRHLVSLFKESGEFLSAIGGALEDGKVTKDELTKILKEARDAAEAFHRVVAVMRR